MNDSWISGFVSGEGCFTFRNQNAIYKNKKYKGIYPIFSITLRLEDLNILKLIKKRLKINNINIVIHKKYNSCTFQVYRNGSKKIIEFFNINALFGTKQEDFEDWKKGILIIDNDKLSFKSKLNYINKLKPRNKRKL